MGRQLKGSKFERETCVRLSLWWSEGRRDDLFWRSAGSGARAKVRGRRGKQTHGHHGDIVATHPHGEPLIDVLTLELKRGYAGATIHDLIDKPDRAPKAQPYDAWIEQAEESHLAAGSLSWGIVSRRDRRDALITLPHVFYEIARAVLAEVPACHTISRTRYVRHNGKPITLWTMRFDEWLEAWTPSDIKHIQRAN